MKYRIELVRSKKLLQGQKWFSRIVDVDNGQTLYTSETYSRRVDALATAAAIATELRATLVLVDVPK